MPTRIVTKISLLWIDCDVQNRRSIWILRFRLENSVKTWGTRRRNSQNFQSEGHQKFHFGLSVSPLLIGFRLPSLPIWWSRVKDQRALIYDAVYWSAEATINGILRYSTLISWSDFRNRLGGFIIRSDMKTVRGGSPFLLNLFQHFISVHTAVTQPS